MINQAGELPDLPIMPIRGGVVRDLDEDLAIQVEIQQDRYDLYAKLVALPGMAAVPDSTIDFIAHSWAIERQAEFDAGKQCAVDEQREAEYFARVTLSSPIY